MQLEIRWQTTEMYVFYSGWIEETGFSPRVWLKSLINRKILFYNAGDLLDNKGYYVNAVCMHIGYNFHLLCCAF